MAKRLGARDSACSSPWRLQREAVHHVEIDLFDAGGMQPFHAVAHQLERLNSVNGFLHLGV